MVVSWPSWIRFAIDPNSYGESPEQNRVEFQPEVGPPKRRRRTSLSQTVIAMETVWLTAQEVDDVTAFYRGTLTEGIDSFTATHPRTNTPGTWEFVDGPKVSQAVATSFKLSFQLRLLSGGRYPPSLKFNRPPNSQYLGAL